MAIGFRAFSSGDVHNPNAGAAGNVVLSKPTGFASTDILIASFGGGRGTASSWLAVTAPAGWTRVGAAQVQGTVTAQSVGLDVFWALGSVASVTFTNAAFGGTYDLGWVCLAFTGVDNTTPIDATGTGNAATGAASITSNAVTVVTSQAWHAAGLASWIGGTWSATGFTLKQNAGVNEDASAAYNVTPKSVGSTGTVSFSTTGGATGQILCAQPFALRPSGAAATSDPPPQSLPANLLAL